MPRTNQIAKVPELRKPFQVVSAPYTSPDENQVVVKSAAVAINPIDYELQDVGKTVLPHVTFPLALGFDVAGEVVEIVSRVTQFKVGDRVVGAALGSSQTVDDATQSAFQLYVVLLEHMTAKIPDSISYEKASVLPLGLNTAACALFDHDHLNLNLPSPVKQQSNGQTVLIWGASSSVGLNAVQLAISAGYEVFATCSPRNFALVNRVGASRVFDYRSPTIIEDITAAYKGKTTAGAVAIGLGSMEPLFEILNKVKTRQ
jgi:NADPH:quinone reductase-like Zn-dependent oxidoreductase